MGPGWNGPDWNGPCRTRPDRTGTEKVPGLPGVSPHPVRAEPRVLYSPVSGGF